MATTLGELLRGVLARNSASIQEGPQPRKGFECEFATLSEDGRLLIKTAPFNAAEAWKATKLAAGDAS